MTETDQNPRKLALSALLRIEKEGSYSNLALDAAIKKSTLPDHDRRLFTVLVYGVTERRISLDHLISELSSRPVSELDAETKNILRIGLYQLIYLSRIPSHAAVSESVALAKRKTSGYINACLRSYLRRKNELSFPSREEDPLSHLSYTYSVPKPLAERFLSEFGLARSERIFSAFFEKNGLSLSVNTLVTTREAYLSLLQAAEISASPSPYTETGILLSETRPIQALPLYKEGGFYIQDEASRVAVAALGAAPGEILIDACACPGSKSMGSAIRMENRGRVYSFDLHENKLSLVRQNAERLGIGIIETAVHDGKKYDPALEALADRVLCDVPCSGYGVIGKKPDIRYKDPSETDHLPDVQFAILDNCSRYVKKGGILVYSTCTLFSKENRENAERFLRQHPEFVYEDFRVGPLESKEGMLSLYPDIHGTDGFFVAKFRKL